MEDKYIVVHEVFKDLRDKGYIYKKGDEYPRDGLKPSKKRIEELSTTNNKIGKILIEKISTDKET